jgi:hypothetical protein
VRTFERRIMSFTIQPVCPAGITHILNLNEQQPPLANGASSLEPGLQSPSVAGSTGTLGHTRVYCLTVRGTAFLWHQVGGYLWGGGCGLAGCPDPAVLARKLQLVCVMCHVNDMKY